MNDQFRNFFNALKGTDVGTKVVIALSSVAMIAAIAVVGMVSNEKHYEVVWSDLTEVKATRISTALALKGIDFRTQFGDSKAIILVASNEVMKANQAAYEDGAVTGVEKGILSANSSSGVFDGQGEREQKLLAAQWSHTELMLETLNAIVEAKIMTSMGSATARGASPRSGSVTIQTAGGVALTREEGQRIADTVIHSLAVDPKLLTITDTNGRSVYTPADENDANGSLAASFTQEQDSSLATKVNEILRMRYGPNLVNVASNSTFDFTQSSTTKHELLKSVKTFESTVSTSTPAGGSSSNSGAGGAAGTAANIPTGVDEWGDGSAGLSGGSGGSSNSTSEESETKFIPSYQDTFETKNQPTLVRRHISVGIDKSLAEFKDDIDASIKTLVGYDDERGDTYSSTAATPFFVPEIPEGMDALAPVLPESGMGVDFLIEKGVEIVSAIAFIFLLLKGMKSVKGSSALATTAATASGGKIKMSPGGSPMPEMEIEPEMLARAQVDDLVKNNPERVAQILSNWVVEDRNAVNS